MGTKAAYYFPWRALLQLAILWVLFLVEAAVLQVTTAGLSSPSWAGVVFGLTALVFISLAIGWYVVFHLVPALIRLFTDYRSIWRNRRNAQKPGPRNIRPVG